MEEFEHLIENAVNPDAVREEYGNVTDLLNGNYECLIPWIEHPEDTSAYFRRNYGSEAYTYDRAQDVPAIGIALTDEGADRGYVFALNERKVGGVSHRYYNALTLRSKEDGLDAEVKQNRIPANAVITPEYNPKVNHFYYQLLQEVDSRPDESIKTIAPGYRPMRVKKVAAVNND